MIGLEFSVSNGYQNVFKNGSNILKGPRSSPTNATGAFVFPATAAWNDDWGSSWSLGELIVLRGTVTKDIRQQMEGYLAQKWTLTELMPISHPYLSPYPNFRLFDRNSNEIKDFTFSKGDDNSSLLINLTPEKSPDRFTFQLGGSFGESLDAVSYTHLTLPTICSV